MTWTKIMGAALVLALCAAADCDDTPTGGGAADAGPVASKDAGSPSCERAAILFDEMVVALVEPRQACGSDQDCAAVTPKVACSNDAQIETCEVAAEKAHASEVETLAADPTSAVCKAAPAGCRAAPGCAPSAGVRCEDKVCRVVYVQP